MQEKNKKNTSRACVFHFFFVILHPISFEYHKQKQKNIKNQHNLVIHGKEKKSLHLW